MNQENFPVITIVTANERKVNEILCHFLGAGRAGTTVVGLDSEWTLVTDSSTGKKRSKPATLQLCDGKECLIVQLLHMESIPTSLLNFLRLPEIVFVGIGIRRNLEILEEDYGLSCKNALELQSLVAKVRQYPGFIYRGVWGLAFYRSRRVIDPSLNLRILKPMKDLVPLLFEDWGAFVLGELQCRYAAMNPYVYWMIGSEMLHNPQMY